MTQSFTETWTIWLCWFSLRHLYWAGFMVVMQHSVENNEHFSVFCFGFSSSPLHCYKITNFLICHWFVLRFFFVLVPITPNQALWWHNELWQENLIGKVLFGLREAPGSAILSHRTKHQSSCEQSDCWATGLITRLCESSRQRHFAENSMKV